MASARQNDVSLTIIVPVHNEGRTLTAVLEQLLQARGNRPWELIVVDDGSTDETPRLLSAFADRVRVLRHPVNRGYGAALKTGILAAHTENVLFFDGDGQHDAADLPALLEVLPAHECVLGMRPRGEGVPLIRRPGKWLLHRVCNFLAGQRIPDINCGLRTGRRRLFLRMLELLPNGYSFSVTSLMFVLKSRVSHCFVPVHCHYRQGAGSVRMLRDGLNAMLLALRLIMLFDPLRTLGVPAVALIALGLIYQAYILAATGLHVEGGSVVAILAGLTLFLFGLLADQVASLRKEISSHYMYLEESLRRTDGAPGAH